MNDEQRSHTYLSPEERIHLRPKPAAEPMPDFRRGANETLPHAVEDVRLLTLEELSTTGEAPTVLSREYRPPWLALRYHPFIIPRYRRLRPDDAFVRAGVRGPLTLYRGELSMEQDYPWCTIGKLFTGQAPDFFAERPGGSGVLVGPNLMLTAAHVIPWGVEGWFLRFVPAYRNSAGPFGFSYVRRVRGIRFADDNSDYAICELSTAIGNRAGWMGSWGTDSEDFYEDRNWDSVGYPSDFQGGDVPCVEWNISPEDAAVDDRQVKITFSSPFSFGGWSGGPLFGWVDGGPRVVGIMRGLQHHDYWLFGSDDDTIFTGGNLMVDLVKHGLSNWPP